MTTHNEITIEDVIKYDEVKKALDEIKATEMIMRKALFHRARGLLGVAEDSGESFSYGSLEVDGFKIGFKPGFRYEIDADELEMAIEDEEITEAELECFPLPKPVRKFNESKYKKLLKSNKKINAIHSIVSVEPGTPTIAVKFPEN